MKFLLAKVAVAEEISSASLIDDSSRRQVAALRPRSAAEPHTEPRAARRIRSRPARSRGTDSNRRRSVELPGAGARVIVEGDGDSEADAAAVAIQPPPADRLGLMHHRDRSGDERRGRIGEGEEEEGEGRDPCFASLLL